MKWMEPLVLGEAFPIGAARAHQVADHHMIEENVVQAPRAQVHGIQMSVGVQQGHRGQ